MSLISETYIRFAAQGVEDVVQAERRVRGAISETARTAARDEAKTKRWMEQHKTALIAIGAATGAAMAAIIASSPSLSASLSEVHLWFSMLAMEMGENVAPVFEWLASLTETLYTWFTELPKPVQTLISYIALLAIGLGIIVPLVSGLIWSLGMLKAAFVGLSMPALTAGGALTTLGLSVGVLGGLVLGGAGVWVLWKLGIMQAAGDAGASVGRFAYNAGVVVGNLSRNIIDGLKLLATSAKVYGADFALSWADAVAKNTPIVGGRISEMIGSVRSVLDSAKTDLAAQWEDFDLTGGLTVGMQVGPLTPNRTISDMIGGADTAVFGGGGGVDTSSSQAELQRLQELMQDFNTTMPSETAAAAADTNAALAGLDTGLSTTASNATTTKTEMERLQAVMSGFNARTPGLSQTADDAKKTGDAVKTTATDTATAAAEIEQSLSAMDSGFSDTSASVTATTAAMTTTVSGQFDSVALSGGRWGSDLMGRFIAGLNSRQGELATKLAQIRESIEAAMSFDIRANDLAAERWGRDLGQHFAAGLSGEIGTVAGVSGGRWGSDLMGRFIAGLNSRQGELAALLAQIRESIEAAMSFDIRANDLAAERWGRDLGQHFAAGLSGEIGTVAGVSGGRWGSDLMGRFIAGLNSRQGELAALLAQIRESIEAAMSFDIRANDLAAERWGRDLGQHFAAGLSGEIGTVAGVSGGRWGSDLMGRFIAGLNSRQGELAALLAQIRESIEAAMSFDIRANDLAAERWGRDLGQHFAAGLSGEIGTVAGVSGGYRAAAMPSSVSSSSSSTSVNLGGVSINISGAEAGRLDEAKLARLITQQVKSEVASAVRGRAR